MNFVLTTLVIVCTNFSPLYGQSARIELAESNVLYRGYENKIYTSVSRYNEDSVVVLGDGAEVQAFAKGQYIVRPEEGKIAMLTVAVKTNRGLIQLFKAQYRVSNLPDPTIYLCGEKSGNSIDNSSFSLLAKYPPEISQKATFEIIEWSVQVEESQLHGTAEEIEQLSKFISDTESGETIQLRLTVLGQDGQERKLAGLWDVQ